MVNPSCKVCKKYFTMGYLPTKKCCGADPLSDVMILVQITSFFPPLVMFKCGQSKIYWIGGRAFILMPCDNIPTMTKSMFRKLF